MGAVEAPAGRMWSPLFVGRSEELSRLHAGLQAAAADRPGMLLIAGEAGVGKSRLIEQFAEQTTGSGTLVTVGAAAPLITGGVPYGALVQALRALASADDPGSLGEHRGELTDVLAELTMDCPTGQQAFGPEVGRGELFEQLSGLLDRLGRAAPLVLALEDLHWADAATLDFLTHLLRSLRRQRLLLVGSYRVDDPGDRLPGWLAEARRSRLVGWLELARFTRAEVATLLVGLQGAPVDARVVDEVFDRSEGNAFFAEELYAAGLGAGQESLPRLLREVLLARVHRLSAAGQRLLAVAAVAGRSVPHALLATVAGGPEEQLTEALREAVGRGLLIRSLDAFGEDVYAFRHALLQEAVYTELLAGERTRLHEGWAHALAVMSDDRQPAAPQPPAQLAEHWNRAGRPAEALDWSVRAADNAERVYAHAEAAGWCERVLELWERVPDAAARAGTDRVGVHTKAARAWECAGDETRALRHIEEALRRVDPADDPVRTGLLHKFRGWYDAGTTDPEVVLAANREAVRLVPAEPPSATRAQVLLGYARALHVQAGRYDEAAVVHEQALTAARRAGAEPDVARAMASLGYLRAIAGE